MHVNSVLFILKTNSGRYRHQFFARMIFSELAFILVVLQVHYVPRFRIIFFKDMKYRVVMTKYMK